MKCVRFEANGESCEKILNMIGGPDPAKVIWKSWKGVMTDALFSIEREGTSPALAGRIRAMIAELGE